jgi:hypothetical protein
MKKLLFLPVLLCSTLFGSNYDLNNNHSNSLVFDKTIGKDSNTSKVIWQNGLTWQNSEYTDEERQIYIDSSRNYKKIGDLNYAINYCKNLEYLGFDDYRLPNHHELNMLRDEYNTLNSKFKESPKGFFWSADEHINDKTKSRRVSFDINRDDAFVNKNHKLYIRCVRGQYKTTSFE